MSERNSIDLFEKWILEIEYWMMINKMFQPIGLELSCANIVLETADDYSFKSMLEDKETANHCPLAWNDMKKSEIHIFIDHPIWEKKIGNERKKAFLLFLLCHEAEHSLLMHDTRGKEYDKELFNIAGDMEIHNMFYVFKEILSDSGNSSSKNNELMLHNLFIQHVAPMIFDKKTGKSDKEDLETAWSGLWEKEYLQMTAEEIYASLNNTKQVQSQTFYFGNDSDEDDQDGQSNQDSNENGQDGQNGKDTKDNGKNDQDKNNGSQDGNGKESKNKSTGNGGHDGAVKVTITTYRSKGGREFTTTNVEFPEVSNSNSSENEEGENEKKQNRMTRSTLSKNVLQKELNDMIQRNEGRGTVPHEIVSFLSKLLNVKIDWKKILKNSIVTAMEKDEYFSWAKPRTSLFGLEYDVYLPDQIESEASYGTLIVARDESGSMSDDECRKAATVIKESKEYYKKVIVIKHDTSIASVDVLEDDNVSDLEERLLLTRTACGGTSHKEVFEYIRDYNKEHEEGDPERISACIFITDMDSDIEETQDIVPPNVPRIWLVPGLVARDNETRHSEVSGKIIPLE